MSTLNESFVEFGRQLRAGRPLWIKTSNGQWCSRKATPAEIKNIENRHTGVSYETSEESGQPA